MASPSKMPTRRPLVSGIGGRSRPMSMFDIPTGHLKSLQQIGNSSKTDESTENSTNYKQAKRRSLLPTFATRKSAAEAKAVQESRETIGVIKEDTSDSEVSSRPPTQNGSRPSTESISSKAMLPPPKPSRTSSLRPPSSASSSKNAASHARTSSKTSNGLPKRSSPPGSPQKVVELGHKRTDSARQTLSRMIAPSPTPQQAIPTRGSSVKASASTVAQKRSTVMVPKSSAPDTSNAQGIARPSSASPPRPASSRTQMLPSSRPTFSTYQQHYSPAKTAVQKAPVPTSKTTKPAAPAEIEAEIVLTLENVLEQVDLLQLSLMHQDSAQVMREYESHAKRRLGRRHAKLRKDYESIRDLERAHRRTANLEALEMWCPDPALLTEHLQTLAMVATELRTHTDPGSRFPELTDIFDKWTTKARSILLGDEPAMYIEPLPESWRSAHTSLALKLRSIQRSISTLPPTPPALGIETSLEIILYSCSALVDGMLKELDIMTKLQKEVLQRGKTRIDEQINALVRTTDAALNMNKKNWSPAWQQVAG